LLSAEFQTTPLTGRKKDQQTCSRHCCYTVRHYCTLLSDTDGHLTSAVRIVLTQNLLTLSTSPTVHLTV